MVLGLISNGKPRKLNGINKALLIDRPSQRLPERVSIPTNVYASAIGLCTNSRTMQSRKPSNSDFWRSFSM